MVCEEAAMVDQVKKNLQADEIQIRLSGVAEQGYTMLYDIYGKSRFRSNES